MATQQPRTEEQTLLISGGSLDVCPTDSLPGILAGAPADMNPREVSRNKSDDEEIKKEAERQAWFQNQINEKLNLPTGYLKVAVLVLRWHEDVDDFKAGHEQEVSNVEMLTENRASLQYFSRGFGVT